MKSPAGFFIKSHVGFSSSLPRVLMRSHVCFNESPAGFNEGSCGFFIFVYDYDCFNTTSMKSSFQKRVRGD